MKLIALLAALILIGCASAEEQETTKEITLNQDAENPTISVEGYTFSGIPDGWTLDNAEKMSVQAYLEEDNYEGTYDYTGTYVGEAFSKNNLNHQISIAIVHVPTDESSEDSTDEILRWLNGDMMEFVVGEPSEKYLDFDGKRAYIREEETETTSVISMTVALDKSTYAFVYGFVIDTEDSMFNDNIWDIVKDMTITLEDVGSGHTIEPATGNIVERDPGVLGDLFPELNLDPVG